MSTSEADSDVMRDQWSVESSDFGRIVSMSDGVFAFSLTLLAVNITLPALNVATAAAELPKALWDLREPFVIYMIAFFTVYVKWNIHRRLFRALKKYDDRLLGLNMFFLLLISGLSLPANVIGKYGDIPIAVIFFAGYQVLMTFTEGVLWTYATRGHRLVAPDLPDEWIGVNGLHIWLAMLLFALSIPLALWNTDAAEYSWLLLIAAAPAAGWLYRLVKR
ncbi:DUF1211 domain-containing protein [Anaerolineae bacterium CFX7]|nr:DUF1211 domain-containing protein [Anaerolineae bacterium CFX7]